MRWTKPSEMSWPIWLAWSVLANVAFFFLERNGLGDVSFIRLFEGTMIWNTGHSGGQSLANLGFLLTEIRVESQQLIICRIPVWIADSNWVFESYKIKPNILPAGNNPRFPGGRTWRRLVPWCAKPSWTSMKMARNRLMSHRLQVCATWLAG